MVKRKIVVALFALMLLSGCAAMNTPKPSAESGSKAPEFALPNQDGSEVALSAVLADHRGAVLAFYPKDDSRN